MTRRNVSIDLGDGDEVVTVTLKGKPCRVEDLQMLVTAFLREQARKQPQTIAEGEIKPCGCQEKN